MAIFRDLSQRKTDTSDRSAGDRARHKELVREAIKDQLPEIIGEEDIIGQTGTGKKIKVPIRSLKEWRFIFSEKQDGVGQGQGGEESGDIVGTTDSGDKPMPGLGGNEPGEMVLEVTLDLDAVIDLMFEDLELPFLEEKKFHELELEKKTKWQGLKDKGIEPRLDLEASFIERLKRRKIIEARARRVEQNDPEQAKNLLDEAQKIPFPFRDDDLRFHNLVIKIDTQSNAVVFFIMDISGSMDVGKRYLAKAFLYLLWRFVKKRFHNKVEKVFIAHHTEAFEVSEFDFFHLSSSGGTYISSGPLKVIEFIKTKYPVELWNIYPVHCSDGENSSDDNDKAIATLKELVKMANLVGFVEIKSGGDWSTIGNKLANEIKDPHFQLVHIKEKNQVWSRFREFINCDKEKKEGGKS